MQCTYDLTTSIYALERWQYETRMNMNATSWTMEARLFTVIYDLTWRRGLLG